MIEKNDQHQQEVKTGERFEFGKNWSNFLRRLTGEHIQHAQDSFSAMLDGYKLEGKSVLDIGSGSGLSSLVAKRLGGKIYSFDYDPYSVASTKELKNRYFKDDANWKVEQGSVLDEQYIRSLGTFDMVYSWGVLHHTGEMWKAIENALIPVKEGGLFFLAIYNDQGKSSRRWTKVKKLYCSGPVGRAVVKATFLPYIYGITFLIDIVKLRNPFKYYREYKKERGMSVYHDHIDWLGGYPFEVASPEAIFRFMKERGFVLKNMTTTNTKGCNQFIFERSRMA
jgi:2-polyprenyl-3-methyl-5-hydroxy-6-metoxy-1,4-benzoquinol methylase